MSSTEEKALELFQCIRDFYVPKYENDINNAQWYQYLSELPLHKKYLKCPFLDPNTKAKAIVEIIKPGTEKCPTLPSYLAQWINTDWTDPNNEVVFKEYIQQNDSENKMKKITFDEFFKNADYQKELYDWTNERTNWIERRKKIATQKRFKNIEAFFRKFWNLYQILKSETVEVMIGQGILKYQQIEYPLLAKKVIVDFNTEKNIIRIFNTDEKPEFYISFLKDFENTKATVIDDAIKEFEQNLYHPLYKNTQEFLKRLIHSLTPSSAYQDIGEEVDPEYEIIVSNNPVLFVRNRQYDISQSLDCIIEEIKQTNKISAPLRRIIEHNDIEQHQQTQDLKQTLSAVRGEDETILFSKESNREQLEIAHNIEQDDIVLVQSPPGTAKMHIVANLMGHFLSEGKSILVTGHSQKSLSTLKEKIAPELQSLCVSLLEQDNTAESAIDGILKYISTNDAEEVSVVEAQLGRKRKEILNNMDTVRGKIAEIRQKEYEAIPFAGEEYTAAEIAEFVCENREDLSYIPGEIPLNTPLPVSLNALELVYELNDNMTSRQELELLYGLPSPEAFMEPSIFSKNVSERSEYIASLLAMQTLIKDHVTIDVEKNTATIQQTPLFTNLNQQKIKEIKQAFDKYKTEKKYVDWQLAAISAGKQNNEKTIGFQRKEDPREPWQTLINTLKDAHEYFMADNETKQILRKRVDVDPEFITLKNVELLYKLKGYLSQQGKHGKKMGKFFSLMHKDLVSLYETIEINGEQISSAEDCEELIVTMNMELKRNAIETLWVELIEKQDGIPFYRLGERPEQEGIKIIEQIEECLDWHKTVYQTIKNLALECGLSPEFFKKTDVFPSPIEEAEHDINLIYKLVPKYITVAELMDIKIPAVNAQLDKAEKPLLSEEFKNSNICNSMLSAVQEQDVEKYKRYYDELTAAYQKHYNYEKRSRILKKIEAVAPKWVEAIQYRQGIHGQSHCPENIEGAWNWRQLSTFIENIINEPFDEMQKKSRKLSAELRKTTAGIVESKVWYRMMSNMEKDKHQKYTLQEWKDSIQSSQPDRKFIIRCQHIIPAWIMSINQALQQFHPDENKFDIAIIDGANQCELYSLAILHMAKKVIILGDDKQFNVSDKYADFQITEQYHSNQSLYDITKTISKAIMLKEHYRSLSNIIGYSNRICYDNQLKPLRDDKSVPIRPATISCRVKGLRDEKDRNTIEARNIVALMLACMEQPEYQNMTFGVISLSGKEQSRLIQRLAYSKINAQEYEDRNILCGEAYSFQNEERDVMFLSMVDSENRKLDYNMEEMKRIYNVAVSRAKSQIWVIHSLDIRRDFKENDIRKDFIEYITTPSISAPANIKSDSRFEKSVAKALIKKGYHIVQRFAAGSYYIDMVAIYDNKKIAIECDGKKYDNEQERVQDLEKQATLERVGWNFIRIRASEYYNDPDKTIERIVAELTEFGIQTEPARKPEFVDLQRTVRVRATRIMEEWKAQK